MLKNLQSVYFSLKRNMLSNYIYLLFIFLSLFFFFETEGRLREEQQSTDTGRKYQIRARKCNLHSDYYFYGIPTLTICTLLVI